MSNNQSAQEQFNQRYITASEIMETLGISRAGFLYARRSERLPEAPICVNHGRLLIWLRSEVEPILTIWKEELDARKSHN